MNESRKALLEVGQLEGQLLFDPPIEPGQDPALRLLGFCLKHLGDRQLQLSPLPGASIPELLDHNDIHHRRIDAPRDPSKEEFPLLIVFEADGGAPLALYRQGGRNWSYCPTQQKHRPVSSRMLLAEEAYEIYLSLPASVPGPLKLLSFAFGKSLGCINKEDVLLALLIFCGSKEHQAGWDGSAIEQVWCKADNGFKEV